MAARSLLTSASVLAAAAEPAAPAGAAVGATAVGVVPVTASGVDGVATAGAEGTTTSAGLGAAELTAETGAVLPFRGVLVAAWRGEQPVVSVTRTVTPTTARPA